MAMRRLMLLILSLFWMDLVKCFPNTQIQRYAMGGDNPKQPKKQQKQQKQNDAARDKQKDEAASNNNNNNNTNNNNTQPGKRVHPATALPIDEVSKAFPASKTVAVGPKLSPAQRKNWFMVSLLLMTGITEAICFRRFGCFPNMMTGNTVRCMDALVDGKLDSFLKHANMITSYVAGSFLFSTLKHTRQKYNLKTPTLIWVARLAPVLFGLSDVFGSSLGNKQRDVVLRLPILALGFGMINAAANDAVGTVTNAVTGHWTNVGLGTVERLIIPSQTPKGWIISLKVIGTFVLSLLATNVVYRWLETKPLLLSRLPPLGLGLGAVYFALLTWYSRSS
jgi:uncharacterized membrane protein YoaK (UPF0700 family)